MLYSYFFGLFPLCVCEERKCVKKIAQTRARNEKDRANTRAKVRDGERKEKRWGSGRGLGG